MKILLGARTSLFSRWGGDSTHIYNLAKGLRALGHVVDFKIDPDSQPYDILNLFNLNQVLPCLQWLQIKNLARRAVLTPIYQPMVQVYERLKLWPDYKTVEKIKLLKSGLNENYWPFARLFQTKQSIEQNVLDQIHALIFSSSREEEFFTSKLPVNKPSVCISPSVDPRELEPIPAGPVSDILCVGRVELWKNQMTLLRVCRSLPFRIVFAGSLNHNHPLYIRKFKEEIRQNQRASFIENPKRSEVLSLIRSARLVVQPSYFEATGLVSMEAAFYGVSHVLSQETWSESWPFLYCDPYAEKDLQQKIEEGLSKKPTQPLPLSFTQPEAALAHQNFYRDLLKT